MRCIVLRPVVDELDDVICGPDTVDTAEALDDADRVPVDIVVDKVVTVLKVLTLGDTVCGDENIYLVLCVRDECIAVL